MSIRGNLAIFAAVGLAGATFAIDTTAIEAVEVAVHSELVEEDQAARDFLDGYAERISLFTEEASQLDGFAVVSAEVVDGSPFVLIAGTNAAILEQFVARSDLNSDLSIRTMAVEHSISTLLSAKTEIHALARPTGVPYSLTVREIEGMIEVQADASAAPRVRETLGNEGLVTTKDGTQVRYNVVEIKQADEPAIELTGGRTATGNQGALCTGGFTLNSPNDPSWRGMSTAGHCEDFLTVSGVLLTVAKHDSCSPGHYSDRQLHHLPGPNTATNKVYFNNQFPYSRTITSRIGSQWGYYLNMPIEKSGKNTGLTAGHIDVLWYDTTTNICNGLFNLAKADASVVKGDSGGPVFHNNRALGLVTGLVGTDLIFSRLYWVDTPNKRTCITAGCN